MANHCVDVICLGCGQQWCERGCGYRSGPDQKAVERYLTKRQEWCNQWGRPFSLGTKLDDCRCGCGSEEVYMN
jgi:hypothetical protein